MEKQRKKRNILYDAFPGNILVVENLLENKKRNILYDDTIYPCDEFIWLVFDDDDDHFTLYQRTRRHGVLTTSSIGLFWHHPYFFGDTSLLCLTSPCTARRLMKKCVTCLYLYAKNLDRQKPFYSIKTDIYKYWLEKGCYLNTSVFKLILRVFYNRTYLTPELNGCERIFG
jgi:hypothetical protein